MTPIEFLNAYGIYILAGVVVIGVAILRSDWSDVKLLAGAIFLDIEKRVGDAAVATGPQKMAAAVQILLNLIPVKFKFILTVLALLLRTTVDELAANIAQRIYDQLRTKIDPETQQ